MMMTLKMKETKSAKRIVLALQRRNAWKSN